MAHTFELGLVELRIGRAGNLGYACSAIVGGASGAGDSVAASPCIWLEAWIAHTLFFVGIRGTVGGAGGALLSVVVEDLDLTVADARSLVAVGDGVAGAGPTNSQQQRVTGQTLAPVVLKLLIDSALTRTEVGTQLNEPWLAHARIQLGIEHLIDTAKIHRSAHIKLISLVPAHALAHIVDSLLVLAAVLDALALAIPAEPAHALADSTYQLGVGRAINNAHSHIVPDIPRIAHTVSIDSLLILAAYHIGHTDLILVSGIALHAVASARSKVLVLGASWIRYALASVNLEEALLADARRPVIDFVLRLRANGHTVLLRVTIVSDVTCAPPKSIH